MQLAIHKQALAEEDLVNIWVHSFRTWGEAQADAYLDEIERAVRLIAAAPSIGMACDHIRPGYRKLVVRRHLVFYRLAEQKVEIIRVLGAEMDVLRHL